MEQSSGGVVRSQAAVMVAVEEMVAGEVVGQLLMYNVFGKKSDLHCVRDRSIVIQCLSVCLLEMRVDNLFFPSIGKFPNPIPVEY